MRGIEVSPESSNCKSFDRVESSFGVLPLDDHDWCCASGLNFKENDTMYLY